MEEAESGDFRALEEVRREAVKRAVSVSEAEGDESRGVGYVEGGVVAFCSQESGEGQLSRFELLRHGAIFLRIWFFSFSVASPKTKGLRFEPLHFAPFNAQLGASEANQLLPAFVSEGVRLRIPLTLKHNADVKGFDALYHGHNWLLYNDLWPWLTQRWVIGKGKSGLL